MKTVILKDRQLVQGDSTLVDFKFLPASDSELKAVGDDLPEGFIAGWASTPDMDHARHVVAPGAFDKSIREKGLTGPEGIKLFIQHDTNRPAGVITKLETRDNRLWIEAQLSLDIGYVSDFYKAAKINGGMSFSVGFFLESFSFEKDEADEDEYLLIKQGELFEVSLVTLPCNRRAAMVHVKDRDGEFKKYEKLADMEKALAAALGKSRSDISRLVTPVVTLNAELLQRGQKPASEAPPVAAETLSAAEKAIRAMRDLFDAGK